MNRNEILEKSRNENKNADPYEMEVSAKAISYGLWSALIISVILTFIKLIKEGEFDYSISAMLWVFIAVAYTYKAAKLREEKFVVCAILYDITAVIWTIVAILRIFLV